MARKSKIQEAMPAAHTTTENTSPNASATLNDGHGYTAMKDQTREVDGHVSVEAAAARSEKSSDTLDGESDVGLELLGQGMKAFTTVIQNLRELGVEELVLPLPRICVLGDQSTGKSSLIEGISGIKVPRSSGTCTRCPLEINLTTSEIDSSWQATMFLQTGFMYEGNHKWVAQGSPESTLFFTTNKKADIPEALHLAQLATLNPGENLRKYIPGAKRHPGNQTQVKFSPNVIKLNVSSPELPNLSFYDLPGVINQAEVSEEEYLVTLVQDLVKSYIKDDACINLLAIPMTDDAANSTASKLVQEAGAQHRTVGVLTKPDRVQKGESMEQWLSMISGTKFKVGHGYYVVKNNADPLVSHPIARQQEAEFFNEEPWIRTLGSYQDRFGTLKLQAVLSRLLNSQIRTSLPRITEQVRFKTAEIKARLETLPEPPEGNLSLKIFEKILQFGHDLRCHLDGGSEAYPFKKEFHAAAIHFRETIKFSYPRLSLSDISTTVKSSQLPYRQSATPTPSGHRRNVIPIDSDNEYEVTPKPVQTATPSKRRHPATNTSQSTPPKRSRLNDMPQYTPSKDGLTSSCDSSLADPRAPFARRFTVTEIRRMLQDAHIGLPGQIDPKATERMIKESLSNWDEPLNVLLEFTRQTCLDMIIQRASFVFGQWQGTRCFKTLLEICQSFFQEQFDLQTASAKRVLAIERQAALTLNEEAMRMASKAAMETLEIRCREERAKAFLINQDSEWDSRLNENQQKDRISKVGDNELGPNPYSIELRAIADVRGYYDCAYSQFVDAVYKGIRAELFTTCRNDLGNALKQRIGLEEKDDFIDVHATGTPQEAANFARLIDSEIDYLQKHTRRKSPDSFWVVRKSTDLALHCRRLTELGHPLWSFELAIQTLTTLAELVRLNGLKEYVFKVKGVGDIAYERCEIYLKNPYGRTPQLAST
ncbi:MAG: hypothetical protein Q9226_002000 [Calogaya cf. arnoldii]